jgi:hypothetical protein
MTTTSGRRQRIAILGAGPIGLEAALYARRLGYEVELLEKGGEAATNVRRWGFVRLFSPWRLNASVLGLGLLEEHGSPLPDLDACPTGDEFVDRYLVPIAAHLGARVRTHREVVGVARERFLKRDEIGSGKRSSAPFLVQLRDPRSGEDDATIADIILDATGVYDRANRPGPGGLEAPGERELESEIDRHIPNPLGTDRHRFASRKTLVLGSGHSALTFLDALTRLHEVEPATRAVWAWRGGPDPLPEIAGDPLLDRARLSRLARELAAGRHPAIEPRSGHRLRELRRADSALRATLEGASGARVAVDIDRVVALVGYRPDLDSTRELQVHLCYATEGPIALAAALLSRGGGSDCLAAKPTGATCLATSEPGYFALGSKSYGRRGDFLLTRGHEQIRDVFRLIENDGRLDLYGMNP